MSELILRTRLADGTTVAQPLTEVATLPVEPGATYAVVDAATDEAPTGLTFERKDEDLEVQLDGEAVVVLDEFYTADTSAAFSTDAGFALGSADLPAVSEAGALDALPPVSDGGFFSIPAGATLLNPATWGTGALVGAGTVVAAGAGTGIGIAVSDDDDSDAGTNTSVVVFDLVDGDSSDHSDQTFDADTTYTIYIRVPSNGAMTSLAVGEMWSNGENLGADDTIVLVGNGSDVIGGGGTAVTGFSTEGTLYWQTSSETAAQLTNEGSFSRTYTTTSTFTTSTGEGPFTTTSTFSTGSATQLWTATEEAWSESNPNSEVSFSEVYLTTMPAGVLTSQGLA